MESIKFKTKSIYWSPNHFNNIVLQNSNGPCFLISLVNALILSQELKSGGNNDIDDGGEWTVVGNGNAGNKNKKGKESVSAEKAEDKGPLNSDMLISLKTLLSQPEVKLTDLLNELTNLLLKLSEETNNDITPFLDKLSVLHLGLDINPDFNEGVVDLAKNPVISVCGIFGLKVIHGWLFDESEKTGIIKDVDDYDTLMDLQLKLSDKLHALGNNVQSSAEADAKAALAKDLQTIDDFLKSNATELTNYGLNQLKSSDKLIKNEEVCIFFRNNHFNTIYKRNNQLYLLLIDEGFKSSAPLNKALVWESLNSINGSSDVLVDGNFEKVQKQVSKKAAANPFGDETVTQDSQINYDDYLNDDIEPNSKTADEMLALSLQQEEDEKLAKNLQKQYNKPAQAQKKSKKKSSKKKTVKAAEKETKESSPASDKSSCIIF